MHHLNNRRVVLALIGALSLLFIYQYVGAGTIAQWRAVNAAEDFIKKAPTFMFDGVSGSLAVDDVRLVEKGDDLYYMSVAFECSHSGYGDRTGDELDQVVTSHSVMMFVDGGKVIDATIDGVWDELNQVERDSMLGGQFDWTLSKLENIRDLASAFVIGNVDDFKGLEQPENWDVSYLMTVGYYNNLLLFTSGEWSVKIFGPAVFAGVCSVELYYGGDDGLYWWAFYQPNGQLINWGRNHP